MGWQKYPLFRLLVPFIAGMLIADATAAFLTVHISLLYICLCSCAAVLFMQNGRRSRDSFYSKFGVSAMAFFLVLGATLYSLRFSEVRITQTADIRQGIVVRLPQKKTRSWAVTLDTDNGKQIIAYIDGKSDSAAVSNIRIGDTIRFLTRQFVSTCPLDIEDKDGVFASYHRYLFYCGTGATCYVGRNDWTLLPASSHADILSKWRRQMITSYSEAGFSADEGALLEALTTGDKSHLSKELKNHYSRAGISHILALSGFHLTVIFAILSILLYGVVLPYGWQWVKSLLIVGCLWTFTLLAESPPSLVRAAVMCSLMSIGGCFGRPILSNNSLTLAAFLMLGFNPLMLQDVGFQLSYLSVLAICIVAVPCCRKIDERLYSSGKSGGVMINLSKRTLSYFAGVAMVSMACTIATAPLVAYHFHTVPMLSVVTNLLACTLAIVLLYTAVLWWVFFWCDGIRDIFAFVLEWSAWCMNSIARWISSLDWAVLAWSPNVLQVFLSYFLLVSAVAFFHHRTAFTLKLTLIVLIVLLLSLIL